MSLKFSINILDQLQTRQISLVSLKILKYQINSTIKELAFNQSIKVVIKIQN